MGQFQSVAEGQQQQTQLQQLADRYQMKNREKLGEGSYGTVWKAVDRQTGQPVAVKQLNKAKLNSGTSKVKPYLTAGREVALMGACQHENIACMFGGFEDTSHLYIAMELCHGGDLQSKIQKSGSSISEEQMAEWSRQMCSAVAALHDKRICHRDLKPHNFMLTGNLLLKLSDFGISVFLPKGKFLSERVGTPAYMAPEIHLLPRKSRGYSFPADVWALGLCIYYLSTSSRHPFLDSSGQLVEALLLSGHLSFGDDQFSSWDGLIQSLRENMGAGAAQAPVDNTELRYLCNSLVTPSMKTRMTAGAALQLPWINCGANLRQKQSVPPPIPLRRFVSCETALQQQPHMLAANRSTLDPRQQPSLSVVTFAHENPQTAFERVGPSGHADSIAISPPPSPGLSNPLQTAFHPVQENGNLSDCSTTASIASQPQVLLSPRSFTATLPYTISWPPSPQGDQLQPRTGSDFDSRLPHLLRVPNLRQVTDDHGRRPKPRHVSARGGGFVAIPKPFEIGKLDVVYSPMTQQTDTSPSFHM